VVRVLPWCRLKEKEKSGRDTETVVIYVTGEFCGSCASDMQVQGV
jgi:hypothetical protein